MTKRRGHDEGTIRKRANGHWEASVRITSDKRIWRTFRTRAEAQEWTRKMLEEKAAGGVLIPERITVAEYLGRWLETIRHSLRPRTYQSYLGIVENHIAPCLGAYQLQRLQPIAVQRMLSEQIERGLSARHPSARRATKPRLGAGVCYYVMTYPCRCTQLTVLHQYGP